MHTHEHELHEVQTGFWAKLKPLVRKLPFAHDLLSAYYCAFDNETPMKVKIILMSALAYFVLPIDAIPDFIPVIGFTDDAAAIMAAIATVKGSITQDHKQAATKELQQ